MKAYTYRKSKWRFLFLALAIMSCIGLVWEMLPAFILFETFAETESLGMIGGADGPTAIFVTSSPRGWESYLELGLIVVLLIVGIVGFVKFSKCRLKQD